MHCTLTLPNSNPQHQPSPSPSPSPSPDHTRELYSPCCTPGQYARPHYVTQLRLVQGLQDCPGGPHAPQHMYPLPLTPVVLDRATHAERGDTKLKCVCVVACTCILGATSLHDFSFSARSFPPSLTRMPDEHSLRVCFKCGKMVG